MIVENAIGFRGINYMPVLKHIPKGAIEFNFNPRYALIPF